MLVALARTSVLRSQLIANNGIWDVCPSPSCYKNELVLVSGSLVPFSADLTVAFRGPMFVYEIGVYYPDSTGVLLNRC